MRWRNVDGFPAVGVPAPKPRPTATPWTLTGYSIAAVDGNIGHVDEATSELVGSSYLVVDTAARIVGRKVLLPAGVVGGSTRRAQGLRRPDQDQIKNAPEYDDWF